MTETDLNLLREYACNQSQDAFTELVRRHAPLVYTAALRQVRLPELAQEVSQSVFMDLARQAAGLKPGTILTAWLYQVTRRTAIDVVRRESRRQTRERLAVEIAAMNTASDWSNIEPLLDEAMDTLEETDRAAILLRYFENRPLREVGVALGTSDDAAQKRVSRAVERLREFFTRRGVAVGSGAIVAWLSANAVQAAPVGLVATLTTGVFNGTVASTMAAVAAAKIITMTTLQKTILVVAVSGLVGTGLYQARVISNLRSEVQTLRVQQGSQVARGRRLAGERDEATNRLTPLADENSFLRGKLSEAGDRMAWLAKKAAGRLDDGSIEAESQAWIKKVQNLKAALAKTPEKDIPELRLLNNLDWVNVVKDMSEWPNDWAIQEALCQLRRTAKTKLNGLYGRALRNYARANNNQVPSDLRELLPYLESPVAQEALDRYELVQSGTFQWDQPAIAEKAPVDARNDFLFKFGASAYWWQGAGPNNSAHTGEGGMATIGTNDPPLAQVVAKVPPQQIPPDDEMENVMKSPEGRPLREALQVYQALHDGKEPDGPDAIVELLPLLKTRTPEERAATARILQRMLSEESFMNAQERAILEKAVQELQLSPR